MNGGFIMNNVNPTILKYTQLRDISTVRTALAKIAYSDNVLAYRRFKDSLEYAQKELGSENLYVPNSNQLPMIYSPEKQLTVSDYLESVSNLMENFSEERVKDSMRIAKVVFEDKQNSESKPTQYVGKIDNEPKKVAPPHSQKNNQKRKNLLKKRMLIGAVIVGVVIIAAVLIKQNK